MSTENVRAELKRFLESSDTEVLCISGPWGAGKTYAWKETFDEAVAAGQFKMQNSAYVSLFGINSLSELRHSIVENTTRAKGAVLSPDTSTLYSILNKGKKLFRKSRSIINTASGFFRLKDAGDLLYRGAFLTVRNQLVCFDDLERAGDGLKIKDILGLASMLCEQRKCKVVLLLNKDKLETEQGAQFDAQLEKVVDRFLIFAPTVEEAAKITIKDSDAVSALLCERIVALRITNIRVIKKIQRWALQLKNILVDYDVAIVTQAVSTVSLAGWSFLQPSIAPTIKFIEDFDPKKPIMLNQDEISPEEKEWRFILQHYGFRSISKLDRLIIDGVIAGYFDKHEIQLTAAAIEEKLKRQTRNNRLSKAWELYGDSLTEEKVVLETIESATAESLAEISPDDINSTIRFLRYYGRNRQASDLIPKWIDAYSGNFSRYGVFSSFRQADPELEAAVNTALRKCTDTCDPIEMLKEAAKNRIAYIFEVGPALSRLSSEELIDGFDANPEAVKSMIMHAYELAQKQHGSLRSNLDVALLEIAGRSEMNADRLRQWGVLPELSLSSTELEPDNA